MPQVYVGLGSNLNHPVTQIMHASQLILQNSGGSRGQLSTLYRNPPMGPVIQHPFVNAVMAVQTDRSPLSFFRQLQEVGKTLGRVRTIPWGPRIIDLDLLLYDNLVLKTPELEIPHPGIMSRDLS